MMRAFRFVKQQLKARLSLEQIDRIKRAYQRIDAQRERLHTRSPLAIRLQGAVKSNPKIGMAVLAHERPEYLELCLDSLFQTRLYDYDITFLIQDDGSTDPRVREIIKRERQPQYNVIRSFTPKTHNSWGAAFNKAMRHLLAIADFDIIGSCGSDALFHPEWLDQTMKVCLWAKSHHRHHILGPFSCFNSSDFAFHQILGVYQSPYGRYVVKRRMGAVNYFYFREDFLKLGFFAEHRDDETLMTRKLDRLRVRNFCTETSYVEHVGHSSVLNQWRPTPVRTTVHGMNLIKKGWSPALEQADTLGYYRYVKENVSFGEGVSSDVGIDVLIPVVEKDLPVLPHVIDSVREYVRHPIGKIMVVAPTSPGIEALCVDKNCTFIHEDSILPIRKTDIDYSVDGLDRSGWLLQQFIKWSGDILTAQDYFLALDADTVLICPQVFRVNHQTVLLHSDEHHPPYSEAYRKLLGLEAATPLSFVAHQMLFSRAALGELKKAIEDRHQIEWYNAILKVIDRSEASAFCEWETYGQWMLQHHPTEVRREYWFNLSVPRSKLWELDRLRGKFAHKYRSVSFHTHNP